MTSEALCCFVPLWHQTCISFLLEWKSSALFWNALRISLQNGEISSLYLFTLYSVLVNEPVQSCLCATTCNIHTNCAILINLEGLPRVHTILLHTLLSQLSVYYVSIVVVIICTVKVRYVLLYVANIPSHYVQLLVTLNLERKYTNAKYRSFKSVARARREITSEISI